MFTKRGERVPAEAAALAAARHPGVVELVDAAGATLRTRMVDGRRVGDLPPLPAGEVAGLAAAVAATLADLHDLGVVHGAIDATHVLVTGDGRPVLCSLGRGGDPADDVAALGRLVTALLVAAPPEARGRLREWRRLGRRRLGPMLAPAAGPALAALAAEATAPDPADRPSARAWADAIGRRVPAARLPRPRPPAPAPVLPAPPAPPAVPGRPGSVVTAPVPVSRPPAAPLAAAPRRFGGEKGRTAHFFSAKGRGGDRRRGRSAAGVAVTRGTVATTATIAAVAAVAAASGWALSRPARPSATPPPPGSLPRVAATARRTEPAPAERPTTTPATTTPAAIQVWPPEPLAFAGGVLSYGGARYALGEPGDVLVAGDWRCTGVHTLALLRRHGGAVFAFDAWPDGDGAITARPVGQVEGATDMRVVDADDDGCPELEVERTNGPPVHVRVSS